MLKNMAKFVWRAGIATTQGCVQFAKEVFVAGCAVCITFITVLQRVLKRWEPGHFTQVMKA